MKQLIIILFIYLIPAHSFIIPRFSSLRGKTFLKTNTNTETLVKTNTNTDVKTYYYKQTLDHFNYFPQSYKTFRQRYFLNFKYWGGANSTAPIFVTFGGEEELGMEDFSGFIQENAAGFKALLVYIEHRYYGKSVPFKSKEEVLKNMGYFNSAQALADYAAVLIHIKKTLHAERFPVIAVGGSYSEMLAAWFRLKYSHLAIGALASSAPILFIQDMIQPNAYFDVVSKDYKEASASCYKTIRNSWSEIEKIASRPNGLLTLSEKFNTCKPLNNSDELSDYLEDMYTGAAQYNMPPDYPVNKICNAIDTASGDQILDKIYSGLVAGNGDQTCLDTNPTDPPSFFMGWGWQRCSEMVIPFGIGNDTMFRPFPFNLTDFIEMCKEDYGVVPRLHWISTYYGGQDIKLVLRRSGSNIIFSNGLKDPYSSGGVLTNLSKSLVTITTVNDFSGSHCLDLMPSQKTDPTWLIDQRNKEIKIIKKWIKQYYNDLRTLQE